MFGKKKTLCPIDLEMANWLQETFNNLVNEFGKEHLLGKSVLCPTPQDFPVQYDGSVNSLTATAAIIAQQMDIDPDQIKLETYSQNIQEFYSGYGNPFFTQIDTKRNANLTSGYYLGKNEDGI